MPAENTSLILCRNIKEFRDIRKLTFDSLIKRLNFCLHGAPGGNRYRQHLILGSIFGTPLPRRAAPLPKTWNPTASKSSEGGLCKVKVKVKVKVKGKGKVKVKDIVQKATLSDQLSWGTLFPKPLAGDTPDPGYLKAERIIRLKSGSI